MIDGRLFQRSATVLTIRSASMTVCGWVFIAISCSASLNNSTVRMQTLVPPPTSLSPHSWDVDEDLGRSAIELVRLENGSIIVGDIEISRQC